MNNAIRKAVSLVLLICIMMSVIGIPAMAAPFTSVDLSYDKMQIIQGATLDVYFHIWFDDYRYTRYTVSLYDRKNNLVGIAESQVNNQGYFSGDIHITGDTSGYIPGWYEGIIYLEYYTLGAWREVPINNEKFTFYVTEPNFIFDGLAKGVDGKYSYYKNGQVDTSYTGFAGSLNDFYVIDGTVDFDYSGAVKTEGEWKYVEDGMKSYSYDGIAAASDGTLYYFSDGDVDYEYSGTKTYEGKQYYLENGIASEVCSVTGAAHSWNNGDITKEPTCETAGNKTFTCTECSKTKQETIAALDHKYKGSICERCNKILFVDVPEAQFYYTPVQWAVENNITAGMSETIFAPDATCTRAQIVTFLWRANGSPAPASTTNPFTDVPAGQWYTDAVLWAVEKGITTGTSATTFSPDAGCTRGQVATFLWRSQGQPASGGDNIFADVASGAYYYNAVLWAVESGITNGMGDGTFAPDATCTRGQIVTFLYRAMA